jgi:hypothetical protein
MRKIILIILISVTNLFTQDLDSLFQRYTTIHDHSHIEGSKGHDNISSNLQPHKCGLPLKAEILEHFDKLTQEQQSIFNSLQQRPERETSIVSPSGFFRIHYDLSGPNAPNYFPNDGLSQSEVIRKSVDSLAVAFDYSLNYEVNVLGYDQPVNDGIEGGDDKYDIYITNFGAYGETSTREIPQSFIRIENDFQGGFATTGIQAAKVTAAHELHHAIQLSSYGFFSTETTFYELTSTAMEEIVYDDVNDYYAYMPSYFNNPSKSFKENSGYDIASFYLYLIQKYARNEDTVRGHNIIKRSWELLEENGRAVEAISIALFENGSSWAEAWNEFGVWCWFTGGRNSIIPYFEEADNYPRIRPLATYQFQSGTREYMFNTDPISNNYILFEIDSESINDSLISIITNADINSAIASPYTTTDINYTLSTNSSEGSKIVNEYYSNISAPNTELFFEGNIFGNVAVDQGSDITREVEEYTFPQPFIYSQHSSLFIPAEPNRLQFADLNIYTVSMDLVYSGREPILLGNKIVVRWNVIDDDGNKLPTGVYIYVTKSDGEIRKGKFVIYND